GTGPARLGEQQDGDALGHQLRGDAAAAALPAALDREGVEGEHHERLAVPLGEEVVGGDAGAEVLPDVQRDAADDQGGVDVAAVGGEHDVRAVEPVEVLGARDGHVQTGPGQ